MYKTRKLVGEDDEESLDNDDSVGERPPIRRTKLISETKKTNKAIPRAHKRRLRGDSGMVCQCNCMSERQGMGETSE